MDDRCVQAQIAWRSSAAGSTLRSWHVCSLLLHVSTGGKSTPRPRCEASCSPRCAALAQRAVTALEADPPKASSLLWLFI